MNKSGLRTWIEIDSSAAKNNYREFRKLIGKKLLLAVVKSNAYGHGLIDFSKLISELGADWLGVDSIVEAESLRKAGIKKPILVLGYTLPNKFKDAIKNNVSLTISDFTSLGSINNKSSKKLKIHIKIDTGMHRQGFFLTDILKVIEILKSKKAIEVEGIYTHFSSAKDPKKPKETLRQIALFEKAVELFEKSGFKKLIKHAGATAGTILFPNSHFDMVRVGIGLYGLWPSKEAKVAYKNKIKLKPVLSWKTIISSIKTLKAGDRIGYDLTEKVNRTSKVAILPIGYWHGFPRILSSMGYVLIKGKKAKVLGRVSMDMISVDVTDIKNIKVGDEAVIIGKSGKEEITAHNTAYLGSTTEYEIVTRINPLIMKIPA
jgi:alanine racemase